MNEPHGVIYIAFGDKHRQQAKASIESFRRFKNPASVLVYTDRPAEFRGDSIGVYAEPMPHFGSMRSRYYKTMIHRLSPWDCTLFLDSDTLIFAPSDEIWRALDSNPLAMVIDEIPTIRERLVWARRPGDEEEKKHIPELDAPYFNTGVI